MIRIRRADKAIYRETAPAGGVLLHVESGAYHKVKEIGAIIWHLLSETPSRARLLAELKTRIENAPESLEDDVDEFLDAMRQRELVVMESDEPT